MQTTKTEENALTDLSLLAPMSEGTFSHVEAQDIQGRRTHEAETSRSTKCTKRRSGVEQIMTKQHNCKNWHTENVYRNRIGTDNKKPVFGSVRECWGTKLRLNAFSRKLIFISFIVPAINTKIRNK